MNYTEEDVRNAFKAGLTKGNHKSYFDTPLDEDEYLTELKQVKNNIVLPDVIKSAFKCDNVELQPIECEKWRGCFDCPHYKAVL